MLLIFVIVNSVIAKEAEVGHEPDYYPKLDPNPTHIGDLNINDIPSYFDKFNRFFEVEYKDNEQLKASYNVFRENVKRIIIMNKFSTAAKFAINEFTHLTLDDFTNKFTGFNDTGMDDNIEYFDFNSTTEAPSNLDWRVLDPLVRHQGPCKSSYVFSSIANIESQVVRVFKKKLRLSEQQAYDCEPTGTCKYGGMPHRVMEAIQDIGGLEKQASYIYDPKDQRECKAKPTQMVVKITKVMRIQPMYEDSLIPLLVLYGPLVTTMYVSDSVKNYNEGVLWPTDCDKKPNHAVLLVGYGISADVPYWIIRNSWGMMWGETGFIRLIRGEHACNIGQYVATATVELIEEGVELAADDNDFEHAQIFSTNYSNTKNSTTFPTTIDEFLLGPTTEDLPKRFQIKVLSPEAKLKGEEDVKTIQFDDKYFKNMSRSGQPLEGFREDGVKQDIFVIDDAASQTTPKSINLDIVDERSGSFSDSENIRVKAKHDEENSEEDETNKSDSDSSNSDSIKPFKVTRLN